MAKESLFNLLHHRLEWSTLSVLDLFSGTGNVSLEFVSRGVKSVVSVDRHKGCVQFLHSCCETLNIDNLHVLKRDVFQYIKTTSGAFDLVYADPPYDIDDLETIPDLVLSASLLANDGWLILEHGPKQSFTHHPHFFMHRNYGHVNFTIFTKAPQE
jgi:16S rRNA (guanine(966)-N(2))-methyltransferase RsmD